MYYHCRELKYVEYGKVYPAPIEAIDDFMLPAYKWLEKYCCYCPQIWLSRSHSHITGFRNIIKKKKSQLGNRQRINEQSNILFGFDIIKGFPIDYETWCYILNALINNENITIYMESLLKCIMEEETDIKDPILEKWKSVKTEDEFIKKYLFIENDQVVVPSLNLKAAKKIICRNEKDKKALRRMGFINDRIYIRNDYVWQF